MNALTLRAVTLDLVDGDYPFMQLPTAALAPPVPQEPDRCPTCGDTGMVPATGRGSDGYEECDGPWHTAPPVPQEDPQ